RNPVHRPGGWRHCHCRWSHLLPGACARPDRRAVRDGCRHHLLSSIELIGVASMSMETPRTIRKRMPVSALFDPKIVVPAIGSAFVKLDPRTLIKNPVMFVLEIVTALATVILVRDLVTGGQSLLFEFQIVVWLWFTVLFANFAEAVAEGRGKAQAD